MKNYYNNKMKFHFTQWELAQEAAKQKAIDFHMQEYLNYKEMYDRSVASRN